MMKGVKTKLAVTAFALIFLTHQLHGIVAAQSEHVSPSSDQSIAVCSPEKLFPRVGETIEINTYCVTGQNEDMLSYAWTATGGKVTATGNPVKWDFTGVKPGIYEVSVQIKDSHGNAKTCTTEVTVIAPLDLKAGKRKIGRDFLVSGEEEDGEYGLYSYFLLGAHPDNSSRARYLSAIKAYLRLSEANELFKILKDKKEINVTYLPLKKHPGNDILKKLEKQEEKNYDEVAVWVLDNYDYEKAQVLLTKIDGDHINGPYIISYLKPLSSNAITSPYLYQDLSISPADLCGSWIKEFIIQSAKEKFWEENTMRMAALRMRVYLETAGKGAPEVIKSLDKLLALIKPSGKKA